MAATLAGSPAQIRKRATLVLRQRRRHSAALPAPAAARAIGRSATPPHAELEALRARRAPLQPCRSPMVGETPLSALEVLHGVYNGVFLSPIRKESR